MYRRSIFAVIPGLAALAACSGTSAPTISAQVLADATGLVNEAKAIVAAVVQVSPSAISASVQSTITSAEAAAVAALNSLSSSTPAVTGATALQKVTSYLNAALGAVEAALPAAAAAFPQLAPFVPMFDAAVALLPGIETWIQSVLTPVTPTPASARMKLVPIVRKFDPADARKWLGIPSV